MATPSKSRRKTPMPADSAPQALAMTRAPRTPVAKQAKKASLAPTAPTATRATKATPPVAKTAVESSLRSAPVKARAPVVQMPVAPVAAQSKPSAARKAARPVKAAGATETSQTPQTPKKAAPPAQPTKPTKSARATAAAAPTPPAIAPAPASKAEVPVSAGRKTAPRKTVARSAPSVPARPAAVASAAPARATADDIAQAVLAVLMAGTPPLAAPAPAPVPAPAPAPVPAQTTPERTSADLAERPTRNDPTRQGERSGRSVQSLRDRDRDRNSNRNPRPDSGARPERDDKPGQPNRIEPSLRAQAVAVPLPQPAVNGPAHSRIVLVDGDQRHIAWLPGQACPLPLQQAAAARLDARQHLAPDDDDALTTLQSMAAEAGHTLTVDEAVWPHLAAHRDARHRLGLLEAAYPEGPASPALVGLLRSPLPLYQAEAALFAVVAGRALLADERGLGKGVQAIAAALLWQRHFGISRVLVLCAAGQRSAWQRAWQRFAGTSGPLGEAEVMAGGLHQRQSQWSNAVGVRILSPEALASDAAYLLQWAPDLVIVDEPQQLALQASDWATLAAPQALVLCGAPLAEQPVLMQTVVSWLDNQRLGPLAALNELRDASADAAALTDADIERLTNSLSRLMLQRLRADLADQLPPLVHTERLLTLAPGQLEAHGHALAEAQRLLAGWQRSGYLADADQWRLALALRAMHHACHRADPADPDSALAEATLRALVGQLTDWAGSADGGAMQVAVLCATPADREQLAARLPAVPKLALLLPDDAFPAGLDAVVQAGVPWRTRRSPAGPRAQAAPGQQWVYLVAQDGVDAGLFDTLADRLDLPRSLAEGGGRDFLQGDRLTAWLTAMQAALPALAGQAAPAAR
jgi:hypothetical protein